MNEKLLKAIDTGDSAAFAREFRSQEEKFNIDEKLADGNTLLTRLCEKIVAMQMLPDKDRQPYFAMAEVILAVNPDINLANNNGDTAVILLTKAILKYPRGAGSYEEKLILELCASRYADCSLVNQQGDTCDSLIQKHIAAGNAEDFYQRIKKYVNAIKMARRKFLAERTQLMDARDSAATVSSSLWGLRHNLSLLQAHLPSKKTLSLASFATAGTCQFNPDASLLEFIGQANDDNHPVIFSEDMQRLSEIMRGCLLLTTVNITIRYVTLYQETILFFQKSNSVTRLSVKSAGHVVLSDECLVGLIKMPAITQIDFEGLGMDGDTASNLLAEVDKPIQFSFTKMRDEITSGLSQGLRLNPYITQLTTDSKSGDTLKAHLKANIDYLKATDSFMESLSQLLQPVLSGFPSAILLMIMQYIEDRNKILFWKTFDRMQRLLPAPVQNTLAMEVSMEFKNTESKADLKPRLLRGFIPVVRLTEKKSGVAGRLSYVISSLGESKPDTDKILCKHSSFDSPHMLIVTVRKWYEWFLQIEQQKTGALFTESMEKSFRLFMSNVLHDRQSFAPYCLVSEDFKPEVLDKMPFDTFILQFWRFFKLFGFLQYFPAITKKNHEELTAYRLSVQVSGLSERLRDIVRRSSECKSHTIDFFTINLSNLNLCAIGKYFFTESWSGSEDECKLYEGFDFLRKFYRMLMNKFFPKSQNDRKVIAEGVFSERNFILLHIDKCNTQMFAVFLKFFPGDALTAEIFNAAVENLSVIKVITLIAIFDVLLFMKKILPIRKFERLEEICGADAKIAKTISFTLVEVIDKFSIWAKASGVKEDTKLDQPLKPPALTRALSVD